MTTTLRKWSALAAMLLAAASACGKRGGTGADGQPGPTGTPGVAPAPAPRLDAITPAVGSKRNVVFVTGTNFSATPTENEVRFGGLPGDVIAASATQLQVKPPVNLPFGPAPVAVTVHEQTTAAVAFTFAASGTEVPDAVAAPVTPGSAVELPGNRVLVPDASGAILAISSSGALTIAAADAELAGIRRLVPATSGRIFAFGGPHGIFSLDPATGLLYVEHWGTRYVSGAFDANGNLFAIPDGADRVDELAADGTLTSGWGTLAPGAGPVDVEVLNGVVYAATNGVAPGVSSFGASTQTGPVVGTAITTAGVTSIHCMVSDGTQLLLGGVFTASNAQEGLVNVDAGGTITAVAPDPAGASRYAQIGGLLRRQGGDVVIGDAVAGSVSELAGTTLTVRAGSIAHAHASMRTAAEAILSAVYVSSSVPGWIVSAGLDGSSRVVAQGFFGGLAAGADAQHVSVLRRDAADVASVDLTSGATAPVFAIDSPNAPEGLARDANGNYYVSDAGSGVISKYDSNGGLVASAFSTPSAAPGEIVVDGVVLYVAEPAAHAAERVSLSDGSVGAWLDASTGLDQPVSFFRDSDDSVMRLYVLDSAQGQIYLIDLYGFVSAFGPAIPGASTMSQRLDGTLVVSSDAGRSLLTP